MSHSALDIGRDPPVCDIHGPRTLSVDFLSGQRQWVCAYATTDEHHPTHLWECLPEDLLDYRVEEPPVLAVIPEPVLPDGHSIEDAGNARAWRGLFSGARAQSHDLFNRPTYNYATAAATPCANDAGPPETVASIRWMAPDNIIRNNVNSWMFVPLLLQVADLLTPVEANSWRQHPLGGHRWEQVVSDLRNSASRRTAEIVGAFEIRIAIDPNAERAVANLVGTLAEETCTIIDVVRILHRPTSNYLDACVQEICLEHFEGEDMARQMDRWSDEFRNITSSIVLTPAPSIPTHPDPQPHQASHSSAPFSFRDIGGRISRHARRQFNPTHAAQEISLTA